MSVFHSLIDIQLTSFLQYPTFEMMHVSLPFTQPIFTPLRLSFVKVFLDATIMEKAFKLIGLRGSEESAEFATIYSHWPTLNIIIIGTFGMANEN